MKKRFLISIISIIAVIVIITLISARVYGATPHVNEGEVLITIEDKNLYNAIIEDLDVQEIEYNDCNGFNSYNDDKGYIILTEANIININTLNVASKNILSLNGIQLFSSLKELQAEDNYIEDIEILRNNASIEVLNLNRNKLDDNDMLVIKTIPNLKNLGVSENGLTKLGELATISSLEELNIGHQSIANLSKQIANNEQKENENIEEETDNTKSNENDTTLDLTGINNLTNLSILGLSSVGLENINIIQDLTQILNLDVSDNEIEDLTPLSGFNSLTKLDASNNNIEDIDALTSKTTIEKINLNANAIEDDDITVLNSMTGVKELGIASNNITKIGEIANMQNLNALTISNNELNDITGIDKLDNLTELNASNIKLSDLNKISDLTSLQILDISANGLTNVDDVLKLKELEILDISANSLSSINEQIFKIPEVKYNSQHLEESIEGLPGTQIAIKLPEIFKQAKNSAQKNDENFSEEKFYIDDVEMFNCDINDKKDTIIVDPYNVAKKGAYIKINGGDYGETILDISGTSIAFYENLTSTENIQRLQNAIGTDINNFDMEILKSYYTENENKLKEDDPWFKIIEDNMDFDMNNKIDEDDYDRLNNYINKITDVLYVLEIPYNQLKVNNSIIAEIISTNINVLCNSDSYGKLDNNERIVLTYREGDKSKSLIATADCIDKKAPTCQEPVYSTKEFTRGVVYVTITADEDLCDIYKIDANDGTDDIEENNVEEIKEYDTGWRLAEDKRTIAKTFIQNTDEKVILQDEAGNITEVNVSVKNILDNQSENKARLEMKYNDENGNEYISNTWTNKDIYVNINGGLTGNTSYTINGEGPFANSQIINQEGEYTITLTTKEEGKEDIVTNYYVKIDKTNPTIGEIAFYEDNLAGKKLQNGSSTKENIYVYLSKELYGKDSLSGHRKTTYSINGIEREVSTIIKDSGTYNIEVTTYDMAGNKVTENKYTITKVE